MRDRLRREVRSCQMIRISRFSRMWAQHQRIETADASPLIQRRKIRIHVVEPV